MAATSINDAIHAGLRELQAGQVERAAWIFNQVVEQQPREPNAIHYLGLIAFQRGNIDEALRLVRRSLELAPSAAPFHNNLGKILRQKGDIAGAIAAYQRALELNPNLAEAQQNLGVAQSALQKASDAKGGISFSSTPISGPQDEETLAARYRAVVQNPSDADAHFALAAIQHYRGELAAAAASYQHAIDLRPDMDMGVAHVHRGQCLLAMGNFEEGWAEYQWPWNDPSRAGRPQYSQPPWDGSDLRGRRVLLYYEQGFGDTIQFIRYAPMVADRGGHVIVRCQPELRMLIEAMPGVAQVISGDDPVPEFDTHQSLLNLPRIFGTTLQTIPNRVPYLHASQSKLDFWGQKLPPAHGQKCIGLVWAGHPHNLGDQLRTVTLAALAPLLAIPQTQWFSLQKGVAAEQLPELPDSTPVIDLRKELRDFADSAALLEQLDLLITVDTSAAHLAGALARPVWMLTPFASDWRWLTGRSDSPWYPTMRLFRQSTPGNWSDVVASMARELVALATGP